MFVKYVWYVIRHKWFVFVECCKLGIPLAGITHDMSKFSPDEFVPYARYFYGNYRSYSEVGYFEKMNFPPRHTAESVEAEFNLAWLLHQHRNPHHWQFWILQEDSGGYEKLPMPDRYLREMLADWRGAGLAINGTDNTLEWYKKNRDNMRLHPYVREWIEAQLGVEVAA